jgi:hypothetical protein
LVAKKDFETKAGCFDWLGSIVDLCNVGWHVGLCSSLSMDVYFTGRLKIIG